MTAVPAEGYEFIKWSDGNTNATRTDKDFKQNVNVTAMFGAKLVVTIEQGSSGTAKVGDSVRFSAAVSDKSIDKDTMVVWTLDGVQQRVGYSWYFNPTKEGTYSIKASVTVNGKTASAEYKLTVTAGATPAPTPSPSPVPTPSPSPVPTPDISGLAGSYTVTTNSSLQLRVFLANGDPNKVKWTIDAGDTSATLSPDVGISTNFNAPAAGTATVTVSVEGGNTLTTTITVTAPATEENPPQQ